MSKRIVLFIVSVLFIAFVSGCNKEVAEISKNDDSIEVSQNVENGTIRLGALPSTCSITASRSFLFTLSIVSSPVPIPSCLLIK